MTAKKMMVVTLAKTGAVLGAATRRTAGVPAVADLVGAGLLARLADEEAGVAVPVEELAVKEVDHSDDVFRDPRAHVVDASGTIVAPSLKVSMIGNTNLDVTVTVTPPTPAADKTVLVVVDKGANQESLKFVGKTVLNVAATVVPVSGIPPGDHVVLASVDGYTTLLDVCMFT